MDIFLNPELNKFAKSIIGNYGDGKIIYFEKKRSYKILKEFCWVFIEDHQLDIEELHRALQNPKVLKAIQEIKNKPLKNIFRASSSPHLETESTTAATTTTAINTITTSSQSTIELKFERNDNSKNARRRKMQSKFKSNRPVSPTVQSSINLELLEKSTISR